MVAWRRRHDGEGKELNAMVRISQRGGDVATAWRVRDHLAGHPLLGGATAAIVIVAELDRVLVEGWTVDERVRSLAERLARRAAGRRTVQVRLVCGRRAIPARTADAASLT
jgi:hypothetical protein